MQYLQERWHSRRTFSTCSSASRIAVHHHHQQPQQRRRSSVHFLRAKTTSTGRLASGDAAESNAAETMNDLRVTCQARRPACLQPRRAAAPDTLRGSIKHAPTDFCIYRRLTFIAVAQSLMALPPGFCASTFIKCTPNDSTPADEISRTYAQKDTSTGGGRWRWQQRTELDGVKSGLWFMFQPPEAEISPVNWRKTEQDPVLNEMRQKYWSWLGQTL